jgi:peptidylamidoglycolate lyase
MSGYLKSATTLVVVGTTAWIISARALIAQAPTYKQVENWTAAPPGGKWGQIPNVTIDASGNLFVFHRAEPPVLKFDPASGKLLKAWGEGMFDRAHGFRVAPDGAFWATDQRGHTIVKFDANGKTLMTIGKRGVSGETGELFNGPSDVAVAPNGDFFIADGHGNSRVVKFSKDGTFIKAWGKRGTGPGDFNVPHTLAFDSRGRLLVGDRSNSRIQVFDQNGTFLAEYKGWGAPSGIFITKDDVMYVADYNQKRGITVGSAKDGKVTGFITGTAPEGVVVDASGNVYAAEVGGQSLKKFAPVR